MPDLPAVPPHKRYSSRGKIGKQGSYFIAGMVPMLARVRPGFRLLEPRTQYGIAGLLWQASSKRRKHARYDGAVFFTYQELDKKFGRGRFQALNSELDLFDVFPYDCKDQHTRGYKLKPDILKAQHSMLKHIRTRRPSVRLLFEDGRRMRSIPNAVASKDMAGITASKWTGAARMMPTPIDRARLSQLVQWLEMQIEINTADLFSAEEIPGLKHMVEIAGKILALASTDVAGPGFVMQRYVESDSGRLYAQNVNLQTAPRLIKQSALHGLWEYDIQNCHYSIFDQMAQRAGYEAQNIKRYLAGTSHTRLGIAHRMGITDKQAKVCLLAIMYGARANVFPENAIPEEIGEAAARLLFQDPVFRNIHEDIKRGRKIILAAQRPSRGVIFNAVGKSISVSKGVPERLAHLIQGVEASILKEVLDLHGADIVLLQHDGFASSKRLDVTPLAQTIHEKTGYHITLEENQISIPPDLNKTRL
ncbi:hypothetical protein SAMN05216386_2977 [Nitrosospira briensis]|uniref:Uncharacterized protein n=1 Tax=Nitrosospira briensis TaxID=35799 RepID=A0A1I5FET7_9PROT|nr:hypothetical protein [Nitrosospira briensis]SFO21841.1 hypothetical protein SAMN05216386_2977 [Nitrosospira briensis]